VPLFDALARNSYLFSTSLGFQRVVLAQIRPPLPEPDQAGLEAFERTYRALGHAIAGSRAVPVPMTFAISWPGRFDARDAPRIETSFQGWARGARASLKGSSDIISLQNDGIRKLAQEEGWSVSEIPAVLPPDRAHFSDVCHLTVEGNRLIAAALSAEIQPLVDGIRARHRATSMSSWRAPKPAARARECCSCAPSSTSGSARLQPTSSTPAGTLGR